MKTDSDKIQAKALEYSAAVRKQIVADKALLSARCAQMRAAKDSARAYPELKCAINGDDPEG